MEYEVWLEIYLGWATALIPVGLIEEMSLEDCLECELFGVCPLWADVDEFPDEFIDFLADLGDEPESDEFELYSIDADDVTWPECLEEYLDGTWVKYLADG